MKERPILFNSAMVRAVLAGTKTQTRRLVKLPHNNPLGVWEPFWFGGENCYDRHGQDVPGRWTLGHSRTGDIIGCPIAQAGDRLWVREAWRTVAGADTIPPRDLMNVESSIHYEADESSSAGMGKLRPGMFMPRWASRITLEVTGVRVERLQEISEADAMAEGIERMPCLVPNTRLWRNYTPGNGWTPSIAIPQNSFRSLWESINGPGAWAANPWVWCVAFQKVTP